MRILALEPYYGGSHQVFLDQWIERSDHDWQLLTLPAHHWKWRMRHAGIWFADQVRRLWDNHARWDAIFCSDMLDLTQFVGLVGPHVAALPRVVYFHENQLTYPNRIADERDLHFALTNFTSALAADQVWFNSEFHCRSFLDAAKEWLAKMPDYVPLAELANVEQKCSIESPGVDVRGQQLAAPAGPLHIAWAARWEHDKNPQTFFDALRRLKQQGVAFRLTVCGQAFRDVPQEFAQAQRELSEHIAHWGHLPSRTEYLRKLSHAGVFVSTAFHEFFGLAVMESITIGLRPLLPQRLSYPELLGTQQQAGTEPFFYDGSAEDLARRLVVLAEDSQLTPQQKQILTNAAVRYAWPHRAAAMDAAMLSLCNDA